MLRFLLKSFWGCSFLLALCVLPIVGCYYEDAYYENAETDYTTISEHDLSGEYPLKNRVISGEIRVPAKAFTPTKALLLVLDSALRVRDSLKGEVVLDKDSANFKFPKIDYVSPYVKIFVEGNWHAYSKAGAKVTFEMITDISNVPICHVDLMTHVEVPMVESLVDEGYPFAVAKKLTLRKLKENFDFVIPSPMLPAESYGRSAREKGFLYALFLRKGNDSSFVENMDDFRLDLGDGLWEDLDAEKELADFALDSMMLLDTLVQSLVNDQSWWYFVEKAIENAYDLDPCYAKGADSAQAGPKKVLVRGDTLVCDQRKGGTHFRRYYTELERKYGVCAYGGRADIITADNSWYYACNHDYAQYHMTADSAMELKTWYKTTWKDARDYALGSCGKGNLGEDVIVRDTVFGCAVRYLGTDTYYYWIYVSTDTLGFYMGRCDANSLWSVGYMKDSTQYICTPDLWQLANDTLRYLSTQRPCDREKDQLRSFSYGSAYYVCDDVDVGKAKVYTFNDTTKFVADSLAFIAGLEPCESLADTVRYAVDTLYDRYYHCEIRRNKLGYYDSDHDHAVDYLNREYLKTLPQCTAQSDTLELFVHPYFEKTRYKGWNTYFHCAYVDGKYQYEALDYAKRRFLEGLADVEARFTCDANTDTLSFVRDTLYGIYFHCEKHDGKYVFVEINERQADYYASLAGESNLEACHADPDSIEYRQDAYGYYFYCKENGGAYELTRIQKDSLIEMLMEEFAKKVTDGCDDIADLGKVGSGKKLDKTVYVICDYNADSVLAYQRVSLPHYRFFTRVDDKRKNPMGYVQWEKCSDEQLVARGTPVEEQGGYITDPRDGRRYRVTTIGKQTWMAENLNYSDTLAVPNMIGLTGCSDDIDLCEATGRLYNWYAAMNLAHGTKDEVISQTCAPVQGICPAGWHIPSLEEWSELARYATYKNDGAFGVGLKAESGWLTKPNFDDMFGFSASPVTWTTKKDAYFMASDASANASSLLMANGINFDNTSDSPYVITNGFSRSYSVRCVRD